MSGNREKISFSTVNEGKFTPISKVHIAQTNQRVKVAMKDVVRVYEKKETQSHQQAAMLVLNA
ncbi:hypothetical protein [Olleya sp. UBA1516]|uniref:hypothetical protein n=1 Tax=Olleya sp. UBA1516 TaxID=1947013 RepID=UPI0025E5B71F|nr:hypothetical protein [Olleya sp. UBA1516]|tara:strand:+ start:693 stop:881 length:189 start_codon:yes stop_codon:yes gene_type:complete